MNAELRDHLEQLGTPDTERWGVGVLASAPGGSWEVVLEGPPRRKACHIDWEIVEKDGATRYRKLFHDGDRTPEAVRHHVRNLVWECIQFRDNPIRVMSPELAEAFEEAVWAVLRNESLGPLQVRFGVWREGFDGVKFVCKVEYEAVPSPARPLPWSWWSSLVRTPEDLTLELDRALAARRRRRLEAQAIIARTRRRALRRRGGRPLLAHATSQAVSA
jgi:hypothetical protein